MINNSQSQANNQNPQIANQPNQTQNQFDQQINSLNTIINQNNDTISVLEAQQTLITEINALQREINITNTTLEDIRDNFFKAFLLLPDQIQEKTQELSNNCKKLEELSGKIENVRTVIPDPDPTTGNTVISTAGLDTFLKNKDNAQLIEDLKIQKNNEDNDQQAEISKQCIDKLTKYKAEISEEYSQLSNSIVDQYIELGCIKFLNEEKDIDDNKLYNYLQQYSNCNVNDKIKNYIKGYELVTKLTKYQKNQDKLNDDNQKIVQQDQSLSQLVLSRIKPEDRKYNVTNSTPVNNNTSDQLFVFSYISFITTVWLTVYSIMPQAFMMANVIPIIVAAGILKTFLDSLFVYDFASIEKHDHRTELTRRKKNGFIDGISIMFALAPVILSKFAFFSTLAPWIISAMPIVSILVGISLLCYQYLYSRYFSEKAKYSIKNQTQLSLKAKLFPWLESSKKEKLQVLLKKYSEAFTVKTMNPAAQSALYKEIMELCTGTFRSFPYFGQSNLHVSIKPEYAKILTANNDNKNIFTELGKGEIFDKIKLQVKQIDYSNSMRQCSTKIQALKGLENIKQNLDDKNQILKHANFEQAKQAVLKEQNQENHEQDLTAQLKELKEQLDNTLKNPHIKNLLDERKAQQQSKNIAPR